jgi:hypothetical protein
MALYFRNKLLNSPAVERISASNRLLLGLAVSIGAIAIMVSWAGVRFAEKEILRHEAEKTARHSAMMLAEYIPHLSSLLAGQMMTDEDKRIIERTSRFGHIFRYKLFSADAPSFTRRARPIWALRTRNGISRS